MTLTAEQFQAHLTQNAALFVQSAQGAGLDDAVPTCPDWSVRDLVSHTGEVYRWVTRVLRGEQHGFPTGWPSPPDDELWDWFQEGLEDVVATLRGAPAGLRCWTFWPVDDPVLFWSRRMADETAIHRVDAESVSGAVTAVPAELANEGIEELLAGLLAMRPKGVRTEAPVRVAVLPDDGPSWLVTLSAERIAAERIAAGPGSAERGSGAADLTVSGSASALFTWLWNRGGDVRTSGDPAVADLWQRVRVRLA